MGCTLLKYLGPRASQKKMAQHFVQNCEKKVNFRRFLKKENRRGSVTDAKMHIFEKFKKEALTTPHEVQNPKGLRIWTNQKKMAPLLRK